MVVGTRGETKEERARNAMFRCPHVASGICTNRVAVPEPWLKQQVMSLVVARLFPSDSEAFEAISPETVARCPAFREFASLVEMELRRLDDAQPTKSAALTAESQQLRKQQEGIRQSLTNPNLDSGLRRQLEQDFAVKNARLTEIEKCLRKLQSSQQAFENRKLLRIVMQAAKLNAITSEGWHFNYCSKELAAQKFMLIK